MNPKNDQRIKNFQKALRTDCVLIENPVDLLYLTGLPLSKGALCFTPSEVILFVDGRYFAKADREAPCTVRLLHGKAISDWLEAHNIESVEIDGAFTSVDRYESLSKEIRGTIKARSGFLKDFRAIKEESEIALLRKAAEITYKGYELLRSLLKEGISEEELALEFEFFVRKAGASRLSFDPIVAFGENSAYPHYRAGKATLKEGQIVLIDVGAVYQGYAGDLTRVDFFGTPNPELAKMLELTKAAQQKAFEAVRPGALFGDLDRAARSVYAEAGLEEFFSHSLGHGIGLETHEYPSIKATSLDADLKIEAGMTFTIEPGLYRPGLGGVRYEDVVLVTKNGAERL